MEKMIAFLFCIFDDKIPLIPPLKKGEILT